MENPRPEKVAVVDEVRGRLSSSSAALLTEYRGLTVDELAKLRQSVRAAGGDYKIYKNTLVRLAVADLDMAGVDDLLTGPTAVAFVEGDVVLVARALRDFARTSPNLVVKGGVLGTRILTAADAGALADVAPRDVLLARFAGALAAPLQQLAGLLAALPRNFAYGLAALLEQKGGVPEAPEPEAPEAEAPEAEAAEPAAAPPEAPEAEAAEPAAAPAEAAGSSEAPAADEPTAPEQPEQPEQPEEPEQPAQSESDTAQSAE